MVYKLEGISSIQRYLKRLEKWPDRNLGKFHKGKVLHLGSNNPIQAGSQPDGKQLCRKGLGEQVEQESAAWPCSRDSHTLGCVSKSVVSRPQEVILSLHLALVWAHLKDSAQLWDRLYKTLTYGSEAQQMAMKVSSDWRTGYTRRGCDSCICSSLRKSYYCCYQRPNQRL